MSFAKFLRTTFYVEHLWWLLLSSLYIEIYFLNLLYFSAKTNYDFTRFVNKIWDLDKNRLLYGRDYRLTYQGHAPWYNNGRDYAGYSLFSYVNPQVFNKPTYKGIACIDANLRL